MVVELEWQACFISYLSNSTKLGRKLNYALGQLHKGASRKLKAILRNPVRGDVGLVLLINELDRAPAVPGAPAAAAATAAESTATKESSCTCNWSCFDPHIKKFQETSSAGEPMMITAKDVTHSALSRLRETLQKLPSLV